MIQQEIQVFDESQGASAPSSNSGSPGLRPLLRTLQRKAFLIVATTGLGAFAALQFLGSKEAPVYGGSFQLLVEPVTSEQQLADPISITRTDGKPNDKLFVLDYPTQLRILKSPEILKSIVAQVQARYPDFNLETLQENLNLERISDSPDRNDRTKIIEVSYESEDPKEVEFVLQKTAEKYLKYSLDERKTRISQGVQFIDEQLPFLQTRVSEYRGELQKIQQQYELLDPTTRGETLYEQIRTLETQTQEAERQQQELRTLYNSLQNQLELTPSEALAASALSENPIRKKLLDDLTQVESQIAIQSAVFNPNSPELRQLREQQQNLQTLLEKENQKVLGQNPTTIPQSSSVMMYQNSIRQKLIEQLVTTNNQIEAGQVRLQGLRNALNQLTQQAENFPSITRQYTEIQQQLDLTSKRLNLLLDEREKLRIEAAQNNVPWEIISKPSVQAPEAEDSSKKQLIMGVGGGLLLGAALAILWERLRNIFYTTDDLKDAIQVPLLGIIPRQKNPVIPNFLKRTRLLHPNDKVTTQMSEFLEAFDTVYANIRFLYSDSSIRSIAVGSAQSKDGKSMIALHLAQTVANMGQRVLLVDANLRFPHLHNILGVSNQKGLSDLLTDKATPHAVIQRTGLSENLFVLTAGIPFANAFKLLGSSRMEKLINELEMSYDLVIYDTPELQKYNDGTFLTEYVDGIVLVAAVAKTHKTAFEDTVAQLNTYRMPCIGVVANHTKPNSSTSQSFYSTPALVTVDERAVEESVISNQ